MASKKIGRPQIEIDWAEMEMLGEMQATLREISEWFKCSEDTIERACKREHGIGFAEWIAQKAVKGKISLRRKQLEMAMKGSIPMMIWLGKQYLGQSDKVEQKLDATVKEFNIGWADETDPSKKD